MLCLYHIYQKQTGYTNMASIEVHAPQSNEEHVPVHETPIDYGAAALRYYEEAKDPTLSEAEVIAKTDTADYLAKKALEAKVQEYLGKSTSHTA